MIIVEFGYGDTFAIPEESITILQKFTPVKEIEGKYYRVTKRKMYIIPGQCIEAEVKDD